MKSDSIFIPADVPNKAETEYRTNYAAITHNTQRLFLFSCDQKIEHMNDDFMVSDIPADAKNPEHLFRIADQGRIGAMATHLGLIARYGKKYPNINYMVKLNGKTNLIDTKQRDPRNALLYSVHDVKKLKEHSNLAIRGIGLTIYLGSEYEHETLAQAAQAVFDAHHHGLVTILWIYIRGKNIADEQDPHLIAGAAGVAHALGTDFVKIKPPKSTPDMDSAHHIKTVTVAAGNTGVICSGGKKQKPEIFLQELYDQIQIGGARGCATGRNIFQHSLQDAINMTNAISAIVLDNAHVKNALNFL